MDLERKLKKRLFTFIERHLKEFETLPTEDEMLIAVNKKAVYGIWREVYLCLYIRPWLADYKMKKCLI